MGSDEYAACGKGYQHTIRPMKIKNAVKNKYVSPHSYICKTYIHDLTVGAECCCLDSVVTPSLGITSFTKVLDRLDRLA
jgi:hypothetical protein